MNKLRAWLLAAGISGAALSGGILIADSEGLVLGTYVDPVGIVTECFGQRVDGQQPGQYRSEAHCFNQLANNLASYNSQLLRMTGDTQLTDGEHAAYLSFIYNVGAESFRSSTLRKKLLAGNRVGACHELPRWVYANGQKLEGLVKRRAAEQELCLSQLESSNVRID
ncbi:lysozyme [Shewanella sp. SE1]|uniref:lysozyme n=1 Tax=Shewanella sp. SE1 TaxID=2705014 RepID=UPI00138F2A9C|nr:lysozyme [Shewanella sp. SE1]NDO76161.1 lysozyme [Shewanella sp. SE1]